MRVGQAMQIRTVDPNRELSQAYMCLVAVCAACSSGGHTSVSGTTGREGLPVWGLKCAWKINSIFSNGGGGGGDQK